MNRCIIALSLFVTACGGRTDRGNPACGIAALAAPNAVLEAFTVPQQSRSVPPSRLPERTGARLAAGPALLALVGRSDAGLVVGVAGALPPPAVPAFGVLVVHQLYESFETSSICQWVLVHELLDPSDIAAIGLGVNLST